MGNECKTPNLDCENFCCVITLPHKADMAYLKDLDLDDLENFQRIDIPSNSELLSKYDKFYRVAGMPLINIHIDDFM